MRPCMALGAKDYNVFDSPLPAQTARDDVVRLERPIPLTAPASFAITVRAVYHLFPDALDNLRCLTVTPRFQLLARLAFR